MAALTERLLKAEQLATKVWKKNQDKTGGGLFKRCVTCLDDVLCEAAMCMDTLRVVQKFKQTDSGAPLTQEYVDGQLRAGDELLKSLQRQTTALRASAPKA